MQENKYWKIDLFFKLQVDYQRHYEPYVFAEKSILPRYQLKLQGSFYDKSEFFCRVDHLR